MDEILDIELIKLRTMIMQFMMDHGLSEANIICNISEQLKHGDKYRYELSGQYINDNEVKLIVKRFDR